MLSGIRLKFYASHSIGTAFRFRLTNQSTFSTSEPIDTPNERNHPVMTKTALYFCVNHRYRQDESDSDDEVDWVSLATAAKKFQEQNG